MSNVEMIRHLLRRPESETLDFKLKGYDLRDDASCLGLVKDVICMANTPRDASAFILIGVRRSPDGATEVIGLDQHPDDADLQAQFADRVYPIPQFTYTPVSWADNKSLGLIEIPVSKIGPSLPVRDHGGGLRQWQVYFRRRSRNDLATGADQSQIYAWFSGHTSLRSGHVVTDASWMQLMEELECFAAERHYVLLLSPTSHAGEPDIQAIGRVPWAVVFDFDPASDENGILSCCRQTLEERRSLHLATLKDRPSFNLREATYWFFARGLQGREGTIEVGPWRTWNKAYGAALSERLRNLAAAALPTPVTCLALWYEPSLLRHLQTTLDAITAAIGDNVRVVIVTGDPADVHPVASELDAALLEMPFHQFCSGLSSLVAPDMFGSVDELVLTSSSGAPVRMTPQDRLWLSEELEVVDLQAGTNVPAGRAVGREFLRGAEILWYELGLRYDIERDLTDRLQQQVERDLSRRMTSRINLYHAPGAGGTTVARRLIWNLHRRYPCCILHRSSPSETAERLFKLTSLTGLPALLVVDGAQVPERQLDELYDQLRSRNIATVVVQVLRRHKEQVQKARAFYLRAELSSAEAERFVHVFAREEPRQRRDIERLLSSPDPRHRSAFYFGLQTFRNDFLGLQPFVENRLLSLTKSQKQIVGFLALAHHYAQRPLPAPAFAGVLGIPMIRRILVPNLFPSETLELLIEEEQGRWRTAHDVIAEEMLQQLLWPNASDRRLWRQNLSTWSLDFAEFCRGTSSIASDEMRDVVRRTFIYRDNMELLGTERSAARQFSMLLEEIPAIEGRIEVLRRLVDLFPDEPHFWAHFGRFYSNELQDYERALECVDRAIGLREEDPVLHHMRGMALRQHAYKLMNDGRQLNEVIAVAKDAASSFLRARELNPDDDHGYISEVQLLAKVLDYAARLHSGGVADYLLLPNADPFLRDAFERAEDLLEAVRRNREGQGASPFEEDCRAKIDALYGRHDSALQIWDGLLVRQDVYRPPVRRQIVWTYLARRGRSWHGMPAKEVDRIVALLEENLQEEPHNDKNLRLWMQAIRKASRPPSIEIVIERVSYWRANAESLEACFYLYVLHALEAIDGSALARDNAIRFMDECRAKSRLRRNRTKSLEWLGIGSGAGRLVHYSHLGEWLTDKEFWENTAPLVRVNGRISRIDAPQAGQIEVKGGLFAFFVPARGNYSRGRSENQAVTFYLGFSYEGLRAWEVKNA